MSQGRSAKSSRIERTRFIPAAANTPLLQLRTVGITTQGRTRLHTHYVPAPSLSIFDSSDAGSDAGPWDGWDELSLEQEEPQEIDCRPSFDKRKRTAAVSIVGLQLSPKLNIMYQDTPLLAWIPERQAFLDETLRLEGRGNSGISCRCGLAAPLFRCRDCFGTQMFCQECVLQSRIDVRTRFYLLILKTDRSL